MLFEQGNEPVDLIKRGCQICVPETNVSGALPYRVPQPLSYRLRLANVLTKVKQLKSIRILGGKIQQQLHSCIVTAIVDHDEAHVIVVSGVEAKRIEVDPISLVVTGDDDRRATHDAPIFKLLSAHRDASRLANGSRQKARQRFEWPSADHGHSNGPVQVT